MNAQFVATFDDGSMKHYDARTMLEATMNAHIDTIIDESVGFRVVKIEQIFEGDERYQP